MRCFSLVEEGPGPGSPVDTGQGDGASEQVTSEPFDALSVGWPEGWGCVDGETAKSKRSQKLDALLGEESFAFEQEQDLVSEELFCGVGVEVRNGKPLSLSIPNSSRRKAVSMRVSLDETAKGLRDTDDTGSSMFVADDFAHEFLDGFISEACEITQKLAVSHEVGSQHFWNSERPQ